MRPFVVVVAAEAGQKGWFAVAVVAGQPEHLQRQKERRMLASMLGQQLEQLLRIMMLVEKGLRS
jgi:ABC-type sugar transport system substrate-binding protein